MLLEKRLRDGIEYYGNKKIDIPFVYTSYKEFTLPEDQNRHGLYVVKDKYGYCAIYDALSGRCYLNTLSKLKEVEIFKYRARRDSFYFKAKNSSGKVAILKTTLTEEKPQLKVCIPFGFCNDIIEEARDVIKLFKIVDGKINIGYFTHPTFGYVEPCYKEYNLHQINMFPIEPKIPFGSSLEIIKMNPGKELSTPIHSLSNRISLIKYVKYVDGKEVCGIKQLVYSPKESSVYGNKFKWTDLILPEYKNITFIEDSQIIILEKEENGIIKYGYAALARNWNLRETSRKVYGGDCNYKLLYISPCIYKNISLCQANELSSLANPSHHEILLNVIDEKGKFGLIKTKFSKTIGDFNFLGKVNEAYFLESEITKKPFIYDSIRVLDNDSFVGTFGDTAVLLTTVVDKEGAYLATSKTDKYTGFTKVKQNAYIGELSNGDKQYIAITQKGDFNSLEISKPYRRIKVLDNIVLGQGKNGLIDIIHHTRELKTCYEKVSSVEGICNYPRKIYKIKNPRLTSKEITKTIFFMVDNHKITELASFEGREFNIDYIPGINGYKKTQNGIITIITADKSETELSEKQFLKFDVRTYYDEYKNPTSYIVYKDLAFDYCDETVLMCKTKSGSKIIRRGKFDYNDISVVTKKNMIIIGEEDVITHEKRYGVIDSLTGEEVIPFGYDKIVYNSFYDKFIDDNNRIITYSTNKIKVK